MCVWLKGSFLAGDSRHDGPLLSEQHTDVWLQPSCVPPLSETTPTLENANSVHTQDGTLVFGVQFWSVLFMLESSTFEQWNRKQKQRETSRVDRGAHVDGDGVCVSCIAVHVWWMNDYVLECVTPLVYLFFIKLFVAIIQLINLFVCVVNPALSWGFLFLSGVTLDACHCPVASHDVPVIFN